MLLWPVCLEWLGMRRQRQGASLQSESVSQTMDMHDLSPLARAGEDWYRVGFQRDACEDGSACRS